MAFKSIIAHRGRLRIPADSLLLSIKTTSNRGKNTYKAHYYIPDKIFTDYKFSQNNRLDIQIDVENRIGRIISSRNGVLPTKGKTRIVTCTWIGGDPFVEEDTILPLTKDKEKINEQLYFDLPDSISFPDIIPTSSLTSADVTPINKQQRSN